MELQQLLKAVTEQSMSYEQYRKLVEHHVLQKTNTGVEVTEDLAAYTVLNNQRMKRLDKTMRLEPASVALLAKFDKPVYFLVITETWCGDAAQTMPMIHKIAQAASIDLKVVLRDENLELMDHFLTNGSRSIAKLIVVDQESHKPVATWGPRPTTATALVAAEMAVKGTLSPAFKQELQNWYNQDKGKDTERDVVAILKAL